MKRNAPAWTNAPLLALAACLFFVGCEGVMPGKFTRLSQPYPARPNDYQIEVFKETPSKPFREIARLDVHIESAFFAQPSLKDVMPELLKQARLSGSDAIIKIQERRSTLNETRVLHVTATGIKFNDTP